MSEYLTIKEMPETERPYEKCLAHGAQALSDAELIAVIIRSGSRGERSVDLAHRILTAGADGILNLYRLSIADLKKIRGIGTVKAVQLKCIAELSSRLAKAGHFHGRTFDRPDDLASCYMEQMRHNEKEVVLLLTFDTRGQMIAEELLTVGTFDSSLVSKTEVFGKALRHNARSFVLLHNHPTGDPSPSQDDYNITWQLEEGAGILGLDFMDHIIIGDNRYFSFLEQGVLKS